MRNSLKVPRLIYNEWISPIQAVTTPLYEKPEPMTDEEIENLYSQWVADEELTPHAFVRKVERFFGIGVNANDD